MHAWHFLLATPMWLKLAVVAAIGIVAAFPAALVVVRRVLALAVKTEAGRAALLIVAAILVCQFRAASAYADGRAAELAVHNFEKAQLELKLAGQRLDAERAARDAEKRHTDQLAGIAIEHQKELDYAIATRDRTIADLRSGALRLRPQWSCPIGPAAPIAGASVVDEGARLREEGAADLVRIADEADAQIRGLQAVVEADRQVK